MVACTISNEKLQAFDGLVMHEFEIPKRTDVFLNCNYEYDVLKLSKWEDEREEIYLTVYSYMSDRFSFWERLSILFGGKVKSTSIVIDREELKKLKKF